MMLFWGSEWYNTLSPEELQVVLGKFQAWFDGLSKKGVIRGAQPLVREGMIISGKNGQVVSDGPFAESKEAIGGYLLLAVDSLEAAVAIAQTSPALEYGTKIEVRPISDECPMMARAREVMPDLALAMA